MSETMSEEKAAEVKHAMDKVCEWINWSGPRGDAPAHHVGVVYFALEEALPIIEGLERERDAAWALIGEDNQTYAELKTERDDLRADWDALYKILKKVGTYTGSVNDDADLPADMREHINGICSAYDDDISRLQSQLTAALAERDEARKQRQEDHARSVSRGRQLLRMREAFVNIRDSIEDEGDRTYFGSTNDADAFRETVDALSEFKWDRIIAEGKETDFVARCAELVAERDAAFECGRVAGWEQVAKIVRWRIDNPDDCEKLEPMDPETGVRECLLDLHGGDCLCATQREEAELIEQRILALSNKEKSNAGL